MIKNISLLLVLGALFFTAGTVSASEDIVYTLDSGDILLANVRGIDELNSIEIIVREDGNISFPYAGDVFVRGKTIEEAASIIESKLISYLKAPDVVLVLKQPRLIRVGIIGAVKNPGHFEIPNNTTLVSALSFCGGPDLESARLGSIKIFKKNGELVKVNFNQLKNDPDALNKYPIENGDVIFVPKRFISWKFESILQILSIVTITVGIQRALKD